MVEFRRRTLLPLDDVLGCLSDSIPKLTRSSLHRCLGRHGISRLPENPDKPSKRGKFAETAIGYVHIDISESRSRVISRLIAWCNTLIRAGRAAHAESSDP